MKDFEADPPLRRVFRAGHIQFDEARMELLVDGQRRAVEAKPLALLHALLLGAGAVVTKHDLIAAAWGNADHISEASLTTAISKLRVALGDKSHDLISVIPAIGYRIAVPVEVTAARDTPSAFAFRPGDTVPGRSQWRLERLLGAAPLNDVWLARHDKTGERRVFKFADSEARLETLRREAALSRVLHATLGPRDDLVRIVEWNFDVRPCFIESSYGGLDLPAWAAAQGGLATVPLDVRVALLARIARTIAAAHSAGVLHGDIKPANILVDDRPGSAPQVRLVDFGAGRLSDSARLAALQISMQGVGDEAGARHGGSLSYVAPELLAGAAPTTAADMFALGILLYQVAVADLTRPLAVGWESDIADDLLRGDIADAAAGDRTRRLDSAAALAERLETLPARRAERLRQAREAERTASLARQVERDRLRRPWIVAAALSLAAGLALASVFGLRAVRERDEARRRAELARAVNAFLTEDLLGRGNPANSGKADETLMDAAEAAEAGIDRRLAGEPLVAGSIYLSLARAFDSRSAYDAARVAYERAIAAFGRAGPPGQAEATIARLHEGTMEVLSGQPGSLAQAKAMIAGAAAQIPALGARRAEARVWLDAANAMLQMLGGDVRAAQADYARAAGAAETMPDVFDESSRLELRQRLAFTHLRLGEWKAADTMFGALLQRRLALNGPRHPDTLQVELNLAQVRIAQGDAASALPELNRAYPDFVSVFGASHRLTLELLATRAQAFSQLGRYADAVADQMTIYRLAVAKQGPRSYFALGTLTDAAQSRCRAGQIRDGLAAARAARAGAMAAYGAHAGLTQVVDGNLAFCLTMAGQYAAARPLLDGIDARAIAQLTLDPGYGAELDVIRAADALGQGNRAEATARLAGAVPVLLRPDADAYMRRWALRLRAGENPPTLMTKK